MEIARNLGPEQPVVLLSTPEQGYCTAGEFKYWQCDSWFGYLEMQDKINQKNWRSKIPFGMIVTWFLSGLSVLMHLHLVVEKSRLKVGTITSLQTVVSAQLALVFRKGLFCR